MVQLMPNTDGKDQIREASVPDRSMSVHAGTGSESESDILTPALRALCDEWDDGELRSRLCIRLVSFHRPECRRL